MLIIINNPNYINLCYILFLLILPILIKEELQTNTK